MLIESIVLNDLRLCYDFVSVSVFLGSHCSEPYCFVFLSDYRNSQKCLLFISGLSLHTLKGPGNLDASRVITNFFSLSLFLYILVCSLFQDWWWVDF